MTAYAITGTAPEVFVVNGLGDIISGPYKNDESAKRRIRDLKRKEAEALNSVPTATDEVAKLAEIAATTIAPALPDAAKLAASSAYGKTASIAPILNGKPIVTVTHMRVIADTFTVVPPNASPLALRTVRNGKVASVQRGVYPAISKNERRKRWNYA